VGCCGAPKIYKPKAKTQPLAKDAAAARPKVVKPKPKLNYFQRRLLK